MSPLIVGLIWAAGLLVLLAGLAWGWRMGRGSARADAASLVEDDACRAALHGDDRRAEELFHLAKRIRAMDEPWPSCPGHPVPARGMVRLAMLAWLSGMGLAGGAALGLRGTEAAPGVEASPAVVQPPADPPEDLMAAFSRGCVQAGRQPYIGQASGVVVARCSMLPSLGVAPVPAAPARRPR